MQMKRRLLVATICLLMAVLTLYAGGRPVRAEVLAGFTPTPAPPIPPTPRPPSPPEEEPPTPEVILLPPSGGALEGGWLIALGIGLALLGSALLMLRPFWARAGSQHPGEIEEGEPR
jgi:hypothetical protein